MGEVERLCSVVMMMRKGRIVDRGSPRELVERYGRDTLEEVFLDIARSAERLEAAQLASQASWARTVSRRAASAPCCAAISISC